MVRSWKVLSDARLGREMRCSGLWQVWRWKDFRESYLHKSIVKWAQFASGTFADVSLACRTNRRETFSGKFKLMLGENRGIFNVRYERFPEALLPTFINGFVNYNTTLTVLHSDYENFAIMWTCRNLNQYGHIESSWLMTRDQEPKEEVLQTAYGFLDKFGLRNYFIKADQSNCDPWKTSVISRQSLRFVLDFYC